LQGVWGSAFSILFDRLTGKKDDEGDSKNEDIRKEMEDKLGMLYLVFSITANSQLQYNDLKIYGITNTHLLTQTKISKLSESSTETRSKIIYARSFIQRTFLGATS